MLFFFSLKRHIDERLHCTSDDQLSWCRYRDSGLSARWFIQHSVDPSQKPCR